MTIGIIPARYGSTRFPGKPLALIQKKTMIQHVYERSIEADLDDIYVATDDERIKTVIEGFGGKVIMTLPTHNSGTDRCAEAASLLNLGVDDVVVNIQGDEPFIQKEEINLLSSLFNDVTMQIATLVSPIASNEDFVNPNKVKVVFTNTKKALYFSRAPIPHNSQFSNLIPFKHIGIYAYKNEILKQITKLPVSILEETEKLEQLRWLENGFTIHVEKCLYEGLAIDSPEDLERV